MQASHEDNCTVPPDDSAQFFDNLASYGREEEPPLRDIDVNYCAADY